MNEIVAVVVTYNRKELLVECIDCLLNQSFANLDIIVVDNNSTDGTRERIDSHVKKKNITYYNTGENLGGAGGFQYGIKMAAESGYKYIWIMDDDCMPKATALEKLLDADNILYGDYGFLSSVVLWTNGKVCEMNRQKIPQTYYKCIELLDHGIISIEQASFVSLFIPLNTVKKVGLPIKEFFIWGDDVEYTRRIAVRMKMPCYMVGQSQVVHKTKENKGSSIAFDSEERIDRYRYAYRNEAYLYRKEGIKGICYYIAKCCLNFGRILGSPAKRKWKRFCVLFSAMIKGCVFNPQIEYIEESSDID